MGAKGLAESGSQSPPGMTLFQGKAIIRQGLYADWFSRVQGTYYQHLDAFVRYLNGEEVTDLPGLLDGIRAQAVAEAATKSLATGMFCPVDNVF